MATGVKTRSLFDGPITRRALVDSFRKLTPAIQVRNPVMFVVYVGSILTTGLWLQALVGQGEAPAGFIFWVSVWLWLTVLFANFAEAIAEGRGKAQAEALRRTRQDVQAKRLPRPERGAEHALVSGSSLRKGDFVLVEAGDVIPGDGEVIEGVASVDESAITGESAPVIRESGGDRSAVTGRDASPVGLADRPHQRESRRGLPRPHDRHGRGRQAAEDAERDRAQHPAGGVHHHLPARHRHPVAVLRLQRERRRPGHAGDGDGAGRSPRLPHPDDDRRTPVRDRDRRHGPDAPGERHRHVGPRRRGGRGRRRPAPRQDRHHHAREPAGHRLPAGRRRPRARPRGRRPARLAGRRDPGGPEHRRAREAEVRDPGAGRHRDGRDLRRIHRADPDERREPERATDSQGRRRRHRSLRPGARRRAPGAGAHGRRRRGQAGRDAAGRGRWSPRCSV